MARVLFLMIVLIALLCLNCTPEQRRVTITEPPIVPSDTLAPRLGFFNDFTGLLDAPKGGQLEMTLASFEQRSGIEFVVVIVDSLGNRPVEEYSMDLVRSWRLEEKGKGEGKVLLLLAMKDQQFRTNVSESLWPDLSDETVMRLDQILMERFSEDRYADGLKEYIDAVISKFTNKKRNRQ